ncbi:protein phosphatase PTC7 homolog fig [Drosophila bipectinata]|uniref:protein phosphatase PTC7 homolog fig n=1 Tax=Drosophila bipectinata TaxID=42026 RepID=UPI001C8A71FF|nr:protein phosphatase PTC7 homolog fig [Drosophila bipectinata]
MKPTMFCIWPGFISRYARQVSNPLENLNHYFHKNYKRSFGLSDSPAGNSDQTFQSPQTAQEPYLVTVVQGRSKKPSSLRERANRRFGEDSWFVSSTPRAEVLGVADGVGGWRDMGVDAGRFAKELMGCCCGHAEQVDFDARNPRALLVSSYQDLKDREDPVVGSSTACVVAMHRKDLTLYTANLGDSGFLVLRNGRVLHRSQEQTHDFNTPFQLTVAPSHKRDSFHCDRPEMAAVSRHSLAPGDLVLLATDGLFDNMPESMLLEMLRKFHGVRDERELQEGATQVVERARELSMNASFQSPFALKARANNIFYSGGGKPDDITLILASVEVPKVQR